MHSISFAKVLFDIKYTYTHTYIYIYIDYQESKENCSEWILTLYI